MHENRGGRWPEAKHEDSIAQIKVHDSLKRPTTRTRLELHRGFARTAGAGEVVSLDTMRNAMIANFEQEDLDVPAFLRKRGEAI